MYGDKWWGYLHANGVVTISPEDPHLRYGSFCLNHPDERMVGPFTEDWADEFEGDIKMVRRRIIAAMYDRPVEEVEG